MAIIYGIADSEQHLLNKYPNRVKSAKDFPQVHQEIKEEIDKMDTKGFFSKIKIWNKKRHLKNLEKVKMFHIGAKGENMVVEKLEELDDSYHVLCGVKIILPYRIKYRGVRSLRSAQMDIVVVSTKGVYLVEVKNWSDGFKAKNEKFSPYEQTERAGRVLWVFLQSILKDTRVTNVLLSVQGNFEYNENYRSVFVSSLEEINGFLERQNEKLSEEEVEKIVSNLKT